MPEPQVTAAELAALRAHCPPNAIACRLADENGRLRRELSAAKTVGKIFLASSERERAEITRLRAALEQAKGDLGNTAYDWSCSVRAALATINAALEGKP